MDKIIRVVSGGEEWCGQRKCSSRWNKDIRIAVTVSSVSSGETSEQSWKGVEWEVSTILGKQGLRRVGRARIKSISDRNTLKGPGNGSNPHVVVVRTKRSPQQTVLGWVV